MEAEFTLAALAEIARMPKRAIQLWADAGAIKADPATMREGSGVHRKFKREEAMVACVLAPFAKQKMAIGALAWVGDAMRHYMRVPASREAMRRAAANQGNFYLVVRWVLERDGDLAPNFDLVSDIDPKRTFFSVAGRAVHVVRNGKGIDVSPMKIDVIPLNEVLSNLPREP